MDSKISLQKGLGLSGSILGLIVSVINIAATDFYMISFIGIIASICGIVFSCFYKSMNTAASITLIICSLPLFIMMHLFSIVCAIIMLISGAIGFINKKDDNKIEM